MSRFKKKGVKILLAVLLVTVLVGACFASVAIYAKKEINKPKFTLPEPSPLPSATALPHDAQEAAAYVLRLYEKALAADDAEGRRYTDVYTDGDWDTPFAKADETVIRYVGERAAEQIASLYPHSDYTRMTHADFPALHIAAKDALSFTAQQGRVNDAGETADDDRYFITLTVDPACVDTQAIPHSDVYRAAVQTIRDAAVIDKIAFAAQGVQMEFQINRVADQLLAAKITRTFAVHASVRLQGDYTALSDVPTAEVTLPYTDVQTIEFLYYGVRFTERAMAVSPGDRKTLPVDVTVNAETTRDEYTLAFDCDMPDVLTFEDDGVMTVRRRCDTPVTVTVTLRYDGHAYTDSMTVYVTELEVAQDV